jgi:hypothetical protein
MTETDIIEIAGKQFIRLSTFAEEMGLHSTSISFHENGLTG